MFKVRERMRADREEEFLQSVKPGHVRLVENRDLVNPGSPM